MFQISDRSPERTGADASGNSSASHPDGEEAFVLHMQQNRSSFPQEARGMLSVLVTLLMATSILPALNGHWVVPLFSLGVMALLVWALDTHTTSEPKAEAVELAQGVMRYRDPAGAVCELPSHWLRFDLEVFSPTDLRLVFRHRGERIEVGHCLNLEERRAVAPILRQALACAKGG